MDHTTKSDLEASRLSNVQMFDDLVRLEALLADLQANQRGKIYTHYYDNIGPKIGDNTI